MSNQVISITIHIALNRVKAIVIARLITPRDDHGFVLGTILNWLSDVLDHDVRFKRSPQWNIKDPEFELLSSLEPDHF